ncbi:hypothetical protein [Flavobacterium sp.]|uniref:hypothetical protein n=1 Tax=Flavobacterium sp. TaxID=239 RepID=UPI002C5E052F|nr:hypothetical protein [Flavobacterium sp.]HSD08111.1 hypothetical protein [Flavobacterium sp.]
MKTYLVLVVIVLFNAYTLFGQKNNGGSEAIKSKIYNLNLEVENQFINEDFNSLIKHYDTELTYFPEFKPAIFSIGVLKKFYKDWFGQVRIESYKKNIFKVENFNEFILEVGTFDLKYSSSTAPKIQSRYQGKYMIIWRSTKSGKLKILSEAFGADKFIEPEDMPYSNVSVKESDISAENKTIDPALSSEIEIQNSDVIKAVVEGNGYKRSEGFTDDGIYMPHFESILSGIDIIKPYMLKTYNPGAKLYVKHHFYRIFDFGDLILINGHFDGGWGDKTNGGVFTGNMLNLLKREKGKLLMYCQLVNNDKKPKANN